jgi:hypothetical protein
MYDKKEEFNEKTGILGKFWMESLKVKSSVTNKNWTDILSNRLDGVDQSL